MAEDVRLMDFRSFFSGSRFKNTLSPHRRDADPLPLSRGEPVTQSGRPYNYGLIFSPLSSNLI